MPLILTLNVGSSSVKGASFAASEDGPALARAEIEGIGATIRFAAGLRGVPLVELEPGEPAPRDHETAIRTVFDWLLEQASGESVLAVGHRVVHGGLKFAAPVIVDANVLGELAALARLAPLHQPHNLAGLRVASSILPGAPQVACFDTAFHRSQPFVADTFALPKAFYEEGVRRYGFHGLSYEYVSSRLGEIEPERARGRAVLAHLGNGASMCALLEGRSVATTMGFTALEGLPMGTRCGEIDPGVVLYLLQEKGMSADEVYELLYRRSGLLGLSGVSQDMRALLQSDSGDARRAIDYFVYRVRREIGAMAAVLGGLDVLAFTGGIGEHATAIRAAICSGMEWLGLKLDNAANAMGGLISAADSRVRIHVVPTDEERVIARHTRALVGAE